MNEIIFLIITVILSGFIIYFIIRGVSAGNKNKNAALLKDLKNINKLESSIIKDNRKIILQHVKNAIYDFVVNRISGKYRLSNKDISLLKPNFVFISNQFLNELLKLYSPYEIYNIISSDPYDIYDDLFKKQINKNQLLLDQQIAGLEYLLNKFPNIDPSNITNYIKRNSNIFEIKEIPFKNDKPNFTEKQEKVLKSFKV